MEETKVDRVVRDLVADHDRLDGFLSKAHVERLLEKRRLTVEEGAEVYRQLDALGISVEDESENPDETEDASVDEVDSVDAGLDGSFERIDVRLRSLSSRLLTAEEEVELGRRMELGRRALREYQGRPRLSPTKCNSLCLSLNPLRNRARYPFTTRAGSGNGLNSLSGGTIGIYDDNLRGSGSRPSFSVSGQFTLLLIMKAASHDKLGMDVRQRHGVAHENNCSCCAEH